MSTTFRPATIGVFADQTIRASKKFSVRGITSHGIFLLMDERTIVFLSAEQDKGPLTINVPALPSILNRVELKSTGYLMQGKIMFDDSDLVLDCEQSQIWTAAARWNSTTLPFELPTSADLIEFLRSILAESDNELASLVMAMLENSLIPRPNYQQETLEHIAMLHLALRERKAQAAAQEARFFAGRGRGLTPSGDDFLLGIVYGLSRLRTTISTDANLMISPMTEAVKHRSTLISANLIECAAASEVDERLGFAFHALLTSPALWAEAITGLHRWGSSSGVDTAAGMVLLISAIRQ